MGVLTLVLAADAVLAFTVQLNSAAIDQGRVFELPVSTERSLTVTVTGADVQLDAGRPGAVVVRDHLWVDAPTRGLAAALARGAPLTIRDDGSVLRVEAPAAPSADVLGPSRRRSLVVAVPPGLAVVVRSSGGSVLVSGVDAPLDLAATSGDVRLDGMTVDHDVRVRAGAGGIRFTGTVRGADLDLATSSGDVDVRVPADSDVVLDALAMQGVVTVTGSWDVPVTDLAPGQSATGSLGSGAGGTIRLLSTAGDISVRADTNSAQSRKPAAQG